MKETKSAERTFRGEKRYEKIRSLHTGSSGSFVELHKDVVTGDLVAIKFIERGPQITETLKRGILNHMGLLHHHVISFKEVFLTPSHLCLVMEYAAGGDALEFATRRRLSEGQVRWFFQQLILCLDYCHKMGIVSRDISLENTLLDNSTWPILKLNAFTKSKRLHLDEGPYSDEACTNYAYIAPELLSGRGIRKQDYKEIDIWSCGVFLYAMLFQQYPFYNPDDKNKPERFRHALHRTMECDFCFPKNTSVSEECKDLLSHILTFRKDRLSLEEIMRHPWFTKNLPEGALQMNLSLRLRKSTKLQTKDDIIKIFDEARYSAAFSE